MVRCKFIPFKIAFYVPVVLLILLLWRIQTNYFFQENTPMEKTTTAHRRRAGDAEQTKPWLIVFWSTIFGVEQHFQFAWKKGECPVACEVTGNRSRAMDANGFVVHAGDAHMLPPNASVPWILWSHENPMTFPGLSSPEFMSKFQLFRSYRLDSDFPNPVYYMPQITPPVSFKEKTGLVMAAFSHCEPVRTEYLRQLMQFVKIDSYGGCHKNKNDLVPRYGRVNGKSFKELKVEMAKKYKFSLVFFNQDCDYFVDDQLDHALDAGSVPVVMATDKLDEFLPGNLRTAVIKVRDFKSPKILADYLKYLSKNETAYNKYLEWKLKGIGDFTGTVIGNHWKPKYPLYCQMCVALSEGRIHHEGLQIDTCQRRKFEDWGITPGA